MQHLWTIFNKTYLWKKSIKIYEKENIQIIFIAI